MPLRRYSTTAVSTSALCKKHMTRACRCNRLAAGAHVRRKWKFVQTPSGAVYSFPFGEPKGLLTRRRWADYSSPEGGLRNRFVRARRFFEARMRSRTRRGTAVRTRGRRRRFRFSSRRRRFASAIRLLRYWLRSCWDTTISPVGRCRSRTAVSRRLTCWPPGPLERNVSTSHSASSASSV